MSIFCHSKTQRLMISIGFPALLFLVQLHILAASTVYDNPIAPLRCRPDQTASLLQLKKSFLFIESTTTLSSWQVGTDCCLWEGVSCNISSSRVTALDLGGRGLWSLDGLDPALFNLTSLQLLNLGFNDFFRFNIPATGFERLFMLTHLNLSTSGFDGQIPIGIGKLTNLISLDLSSNYDGDITVGDSNSLVLQEPTFQTLVANLSNLRELNLDGVDMSSSGEEWCNALAKFTPHLQVLSMEGCNLRGHIHPSLSNLHSLAVINLGYNYGITAGPLPEFFADFLNLSVLQLAAINLEGWFPERIFQLKKLRVLDVSYNANLSVYLSSIPNGNSIETLELDETNFSSANSNSFSTLKSLKELSLDGKFFSMDLPSSFGIPKSLHKLKFSCRGLLRASVFSWIGDFKNLTSLELYNCDFSRIRPSSSDNFKNLRSLILISCNLTGPTLSAIGDLMDLRTLEFSSCLFFGPIPSKFGNLKNLISMHITACDFSGQIPSAIGNLTNLRTLEISYCMVAGLRGPIPYTIGKLKKLTILQLSNCGFSGRVPGSIANLTQLISLDLSDNMVTGKIPTSLFTLPAMRILDLSYNKLSGHIKEFDASSSCLVVIYLVGSQLSGEIPKSFFQLTDLVALFLGWDNLSGLVELASFWRLRNLTVLDLSNNLLSVTDGKGNNSQTTYCPPQFWFLGLGSCNLTKLPNCIMSFDGIYHLNLADNKISGTVPMWIWEKFDHGLRYLNLSHNMFTSMQLSSYVLPSPPLVTFDLSFNRLQGEIPVPTMSRILDYSNNNFFSIPPNFTFYLSQTVSLKMSKNNIRGDIPHSICNSSGLQLFDLSYNNFSGTIPSCLLGNNHIMILNLRENHFHGTLSFNSSSNKDQCALQTIDFNGNKIEGQLPRSLANCTGLEVLDFGNNQIVDTFPSWLGRLSNLHVLVLRSNRFYGSIGDLVGDDKSKEYFSSLQIIDLASNNFSGNLHPHWFRKLKSMMQKFDNTGKLIDHQHLFGISYQDSVTITYKGLYITFERILTTLTTIDFSNNALEGSIPGSIGRLVSLHVLNMSHNAFAGNIPSQLGRMTELEALDMSSNQLSGEIPQELADLTFLGVLNLSNNQLVGRIPQSRQFDTFQNDSYEGNVGLSGPPLSKQCNSLNAPSEAASKSEKHIDIVLFLFVGLGVGIGFAASILMRWGRIGKWFQIGSINLQT